MTNQLQILETQNAHPWQTFKYRLFDHWCASAHFIKLIVSNRIWWFFAKLASKAYLAARRRPSLQHSIGRFVTSTSQSVVQSPNAIASNFIIEKLRACSRRRALSAERNHVASLYSFTNTRRPYLQTQDCRLTLEFPFLFLCRARYCHSKASVCPFVII